MRVAAKVQEVKFVDWEGPIVGDDASKLRLQNLFGTQSWQLVEFFVKQRIQIQADYAVRFYLMDQLKEDVGALFRP
jgi:hypothetical protein